ncbi:MAG: DNA replication and repair protein RecF [Saprospiraceae bacterium]
MNISQLKLVNFRNYTEEKIDFHPSFNIITGLNGMGKTNILDAIHFLCLGKGYFSGMDKFSVQHENTFFRLEGTFIETNKNTNVVLKYQMGGKKELEVSGVVLDRLSDHVGQFPCVIFAPEDIKLLQDTSEARRNFLNNTLVQFDKDYLTAVIFYNKLLKSRNVYLKSMLATHAFDDLYLESLQEQMVHPAKVIFEKRKQLIGQLQQVFEEVYAILSKKREKCVMLYESQLHKEDPLDLWNSSMSRDKILGRTTCGIHKDDLVLWMNSKPIKNFGSQGQLKSFILALKFSQYRILETSKKVKPLIMLDDIFDKLDEQRVGQLMELVSGDSFGQVFVTDTDNKRIPSLLKNLKKGGRHFTIESGTIKQVQDYEPAQ